MADSERKSLIELGTAGLGHRASADSADVFTRGNVRIRVIWAGDAMSRATTFHNEMYEAYTRQPGTVAHLAQALRPNTAANSRNAGRGSHRGVPSPRTCTST